MQQLRRNAKAPQTGFFSTLDELIQQAPFTKPVPYSAWEEYLRPGRALEREGIKFPLKKEELQYSGFNDLLSDGIEQNQALDKDYLLGFIRSRRPDFQLDSRAAARRQTQLGLPKNLDISRQLKDQYANQPLSNSEWASRSPEYPELSLRSSVTEIPHSYEESITRMPDTINDISHFNRDDLSWSRTTKQPLPGGQRMRFIEEIQSDLHSKANEKMLPNFQPSEKLTDDLTQAGASYWTNVNRSKTISAENLKYLQGQVPKGGASFNELESLKADMVKRGYESPKNVLPNYAVSDAPFKSPGDHGLLELKKQLLNSVYAGDDMLGIIPGDMQITRYSQGMTPQAEAGMRHIYDSVNPGQLEKLARQYGAPFEKIQQGFVPKTNARPGTLMDLEFETPSELAIGNGFEDVIDQDLTGAMDTAQKLTQEYAEIGAIPAENFDNVMKLIAKAKREFETLKARDSTVMPHSASYNQLVRIWEKAHQKYGELTGANQTKTFEVPVMKTPEEIRERIKRTGVPLWTLPAAAVGAEAAMENDEPQGYAKGGVVKALAELKQKISPWRYRRAERVFDESPDLANLYSERGVYNLANDYAPLVMFKPGEFRRYAEPFYANRGRQNGVPEVDRDHALNQLGDMLESGGMNDTPFLGNDYMALNPNLFKTNDHEGRHRSLIAGELLKNKYPVHMLWDDALGNVNTRSVQSTPRYDRERRSMIHQLGDDPTTSLLRPTTQAHVSKIVKPWITSHDDVGLAEENLQEIITEYNRRINSIQQQESHRGNITSRPQPYKMKEGRAFKDGGEVKAKTSGETAFARLAELSKKFGTKASEKRRARFVTMAAANILGRDKDGNADWPTSPFGWGEEDGVIPGIVDATTQVAVIPPMIGQAMGMNVEPLDSVVAASEDSEQLQNRLRELAGIGHPQGWMENFEEGLGSMATQIPVGRLGVLAKNLMQKLAMAPLEYLGPIVDPKASNYLMGAAGGATFNSALESGEVLGRLAQRLRKPDERPSMDEGLASHYSRFNR